uniref:Single-stranded DNA-binding protein 3-like n=1 Tax=Gouania willdenowi TaxID=441366 RepID=A0A8C5I2L7_GOUWI
MTYQHCFFFLLLCFHLNADNVSTERTKPISRPLKSIYFSPSAAKVLALYVYEYLLHVGAQKSAQTFLSEIRWEKNITLGEPPGFLHSWWCVFWDLYCAAPDRRETCEHSSEAKAFHDYVSVSICQSPHAQPPPHNPNNPMMGPHGQPFMSPRYPGGPRPTLRMPNQPPGGIPGSQPLLPNSLDPTRPQGHPNMGGPMRMNPPRGMAMGPQNYGGMRPPPNSMGGPMPGMNMSVILKTENIYTMMNPIGPGGNRPNFPMGPGPDGPMGAMGAMEPHHMNGSLGSGDMDGLPKSSPNNMGGMNNPPGTPRDDGEMGGNFLNPFQSESVSIEGGRDVPQPDELSTPLPHHPTPSTSEAVGECK